MALKEFHRDGQVDVGGGELMGRVVGRGRERKPSRLSEGQSTRALDYELRYAGKVDEAAVLAGPRTECTMTERLAGRVVTDWRNRIYLGDNLGILRALHDDPTVHGRVALVYIDPPFATGSTFASRDSRTAYDDHARGAEFLEFVRQRLILLRELLAPSGSIYVHLGAMAFPVKVLMDELFGPANFRNWITRKKSNRKNFTRRQYGNISDYLLFYTRSSDAKFHRAYESWTEAWARTEYPHVEQGTGRRFKKVPIHAPGTRNGQTGKPWRGKLPPPGKHWQYPPETLEQLDAQGEIAWSPTGNPRRKVYLDQSEGVPVQDIWLDFRDAHNQNVDATGYPTEKNLSMLRRIVAASSDPGDLVLDCFMGSGTTLIAAEEAGRRWIGIDSSTTAVETTLSRLIHGSGPMGDFVNGLKERPRNGSAVVTPACELGLDVYVEDRPQIER